jgi:multicomponent Na+:H+ antiporter subunit F
MNTFFLAVAAFLVLNVGAGMLRVVWGPSPADRMLAAQLFGSTGVAVLLLLSQAMAMPGLRDVALVFVLLAVVVSVAFARRGWVRTGQPDPAAEEGE